MRSPLAPSRSFVLGVMQSESTLFSILTRKYLVKVAICGYFAYDTTYHEEEFQMLLQFAVENYRSFKTEVVLSLVPAKSRIHPKHVLASVEHGRKVKALPLAVLYGANASGKSNLVSALARAQSMIVDSTRSESPIQVTPFRLDPETLEKPSRFEFVLKHAGVLYTYGFTATEHEVKEEWLFAVYVRQEVKLFERITKDGRARVEAGNKLASTKEEKQRIQFIAEGTRPNQLFLTEASERNVDILKPLMKWFRHHLKVIAPDAKYLSLLQRAYDDEDFAGFLGQFLSAADTGIENIRVDEEKRDEDQFFSGWPDNLKRELRDGLSSATNNSILVRVGESIRGLRQMGDESLQILTLKTKHRRSDGEEIFFDTQEESDGTNRMLHLAPALLNLESYEGVYVIDELDRSLHPSLCRAFVDAFLLGITERGCRGQIILTTHETSLLDLDLLRRDEVWFVEKDGQGSSQITSLAEFDVRADFRIAKGYINGRFGAIPFVGDIRDLFESGDCK